MVELKFVGTVEGKESVAVSYEDQVAIARLAGGIGIRLGIRLLRKSAVDTGHLKSYLEGKDGFKFGDSEIMETSAMLLSIANLVEKGGIKDNDREIMAKGMMARVKILVDWLKRTGLSWKKTEYDWRNFRNAVLAESSELDVELRDLGLSGKEAGRWE